MVALRHRKKEWEQQNQQVLIRLVQISADVSVEVVKVAGLLTSFLIYLIYKLVSGMLALAIFLMCAPKMVQKTAPGLRPLEQHEFNQLPLETQIKYAQRWR